MVSLTQSTARRRTAQRTRWPPNRRCSTGILACVFPELRQECLWYLHTMERRTFLAMPAAAAALPDTPKYHVVSAFQPKPHPVMPGPYPGSVISSKADNSIDPETEKVDATVVADIVRR